MSVKRGFLWGKVSGVLAGGLFGYFSFSLPYLLDAVLEGRFFTTQDLANVAIILAMLGVFVGAIVGAFLGTVFGCLIAWLQMAENASIIWSLVWSVLALFISFSLLWSNPPNLFAPAIWVWLGGITGWIAGRLFESRVTLTPQNNTEPVGVTRVVAQANVPAT